MNHKKPKLATSSVTNGQGNPENPGKVRELIQWSVKSCQGIIACIMTRQSCDYVHYVHFVLWFIQSET